MTIIINNNELLAKELLFNPENGPVITLPNLSFGRVCIQKKNLAARNIIAA